MFKEYFKYYKSKKPPPDFSNVLDFSNPAIINDKIKSYKCIEVPFAEVYHGLKPVCCWEIYELNNKPGLIFIRNPFTSTGQRYWAVRCLKDFTKPPNKLNIDIHGILPEDTSWWELCQKEGYEGTLEKLRWSTLGYHHNWDTKVYSESNKSEFPADLASLIAYVAKALGYHNFEAEAAIINYYHLNSTLSGHTDHSEQYLEAPLFSCSLGQSAVFLLGGTTLDEKPVAMFLHSGDIIVMSKESRLCYHGVPKIIKSAEMPWNESIKDEHSCIPQECKSESHWEPFNKYLKNCRININVRQVLKENHNRL